MKVSWCHFLYIILVFPQVVAAQSSQPECSWISCKWISKTDTAYSMIEKKVILRDDTIFHQEVVFDLFSNQIIRMGYMDTFLIESRSVMALKNNKKSLYFNYNSFVNSDTIYYLEAIWNGTDGVFSYMIPDSIVTYANMTLFKYNILYTDSTKSYTDYTSDIRLGSNITQMGYYLVHPIFGVVTREDWFDSFSIGKKKIKEGRLYNYYIPANSNCEKKIISLLDLLTD